MRLTHRLRETTRRRLAVVVAGPCIAWFLGMATVAADEGWLINRLQVRLEIQPDGVLAANEALDVDFRELSRHGIFRDIPYIFDFDTTHAREYQIDLTSVTSADGRRHQVATSTVGAMRRFTIGDPNRTISGKETYRIAYRVQQALNGFADHDELYWNATGLWPVEVAAASVVVAAPSGAIDRVECFQGPTGSTERCGATFTPNDATFSATRPLAEGEQMTIVVGLRKGAVPEPSPRLITKSRHLTTESFGRTRAVLAWMGLECAVLIGGIGAWWWRVGRDRRYVAALHHTAQDNQEERVPLFGSRPIAVEFKPPDNLRPGQMGLIIDERADTLDITATIIDLAVRGYVKITELPKEGWLGNKDWLLDQLKLPDEGLLEYEQIVLRGLFQSARSQKVSDLKKKFYDDLAHAKAALYKDAFDRGWFPRSPNTIRTVTLVLGLFVAFASVFLMTFLGLIWGAALLGLPVLAAGVLLAIGSGAMPRRTAAGTEVLHRTLGFVRYMKTAETQQQAFAERANIFTQYLPYAIAFKCVDQWARAFKDIDMQAATAGWYAGAVGFNAGNFSSNLAGFSSSVSSTMASTPGGSGHSGFSRGSSGGGGGGGRGGSW